MNQPTHDDPTEPATEMAQDIEADLRVIVDEEYELLRLKLAEKEALEEVQLLDDLMLLQGAQLHLAQGKFLEPEWKEALLKCFAHQRDAQMEQRQPLTDATTSI